MAQNTRLNQIIAIEKGAKAKANETITQAYHLIQKSGPFIGLSRTYEPKEEGGERFPAESTKVQKKARDLLKEATVALTRLFDVVANKDNANCQARADVRVDGQVLLTGVPVTHLLFLEKQLNDVHTFVGKLPVLDQAEDWSFNENADSYASRAIESAKTKKVPRVLVKAKATEQHPEQVDVYHEDVVVGTWTTIKYSGALPASTVNNLLERVERLQEAVKMAREEANNTEISDVKYGERIFDYLLGDLKK